MVQMWDSLFSELNPEIGEALRRGDAETAFQQMHMELKTVWRNIWSVLCDGGIVCIIVGDALRKTGKNFSLFPNHAVISSTMRSIGFTQLPGIIWRKQTNKPNKFMGSGMYPAGAYATLEHEHILVFRKNGLRKFVSESLRKKSALFYEERNRFYSDIWYDVKGERQELYPRGKAASFPFSIASRLVRMFSIYEDVVLDPFSGTGTTAMAAATWCRNSISIEIDAFLHRHAISRFASKSALITMREEAQRRIREHVEYCNGRNLKFTNRHYGFQVTTNQEREIIVPVITEVSSMNSSTFQARYEE